MAVIQLDKRISVGVFWRNGLTKVTERSYTGGLYEEEVAVQRDGYMRETNPVLLHFYSTPPYPYLDEKHTKFEDACRFFGLTDADFDDKQKACVEVNPWICFTEDYCLVLYFGDDKPQRKTKCVKGNTQHRRTWARNFFDEGYEYTYWKVKDPTKLIICRCNLYDGMGISYAFPEVNIPNRPLEYVDLSQIDPFRASDEYDYSEEEKTAILAEERRKEEDKRKVEDELERRKRTAGYCNECGAEHAEYIPFINRYLCRECFYKIMHPDAL